MADIKLPFRLGPSGAAGTEDERDLASAAASLQRRSAEAQALGLSDVQGTGARGFLAGALDYLTRPQSAVLGFLTGLTGVGVQPGEEENAFIRAFQGLSGAERFRGADVFGEAPADANIVDRLVRGAAGFGVDVATDPLTYLTFGTGGVLRGPAAAAATRAQVLEQAPRVLESIPTPTIAPTPLVGLPTATEAATQAAKGRISLLTEQPVTRLGQVGPSLTRGPVSPIEAAGLAPRVPARGTVPTITQPAPLATTAPAPSDLVTRLADVAAERRILEGPVGIRTGIQSVLEESGRYAPEQIQEITSRIVKGLTGEVRGGIGIRIPFAGLDETGRLVGTDAAVTRRVLDITPGAGRITDAVGLRGVAEATRGVYNEYRSSGFFKGWSKLMNGRFGAEYADLIRNLHSGKGGMTYEFFRNNIAKDNERIAATFLRDKVFSSSLQAFEKMTVESGQDPKSVAAARDRFFQAGRAMQLPPNASEADKLGFQIAADMNELYESVFDEVLDATTRAGIEIGNQRTLIDNFVPRTLSAKEIARRAERGKKTGPYSAGKSRIVEPDVDEFGRLTGGSAEELNKRFGREVYETDAEKVLAQVLASYSEVIQRANIIADLKEIGGLKAVDFQDIRRVSTPRLAKRGVKIQSVLQDVTTRLSNAMNEALAAGDTARVQSIGVAIDKVAADNAVIRELISNIDASNPEEVKKIGNLVNTLKRALAAGEDVGVTITKSEKDRLLSRRGLVRTKATPTNVEDLLESGYRPVGEDVTVKIPAGLTNTYAPQAIKDAVERYFKVETSKVKLSPFFNDVYQPYYTLFKTFATVGRPGGYHARNLQGAWWNNYLGDVSGGDHKLSASIISQGKAATKEAEQAIKNVRSGRASGLSADLDQVAKDIVTLGKFRGSTVVEYEVAQLADVLLMSKLSKVKIGQTNAADVLQAAQQQGILRNNRRLEYLRNEARAEGRELSDALLDPKSMNLFRGRSQAELNKTQKLLNSAVNLRYLQWSGEMADLSENYVRLAAFLSGARRYGVADGGQAAGYLTKALHFDYADLSTFERDVLKNIIPFYTWSRRNIPLQFFSLLGQPGKFNKLQFAKDELQTQLAADGDNESMAQIVPEWMRDKLGFVSSLTYKGSPITIGIESPAMDLNKFLAFGSPKAIAEKTVGSVVSASNPIAKALVEGLTGVDTFTGGKITDKGAEFPFPIPGLTFKGPEGENRINARGYGIAKDLLPPLGTIMRLIPAGAEGDRWLTNFLSTTAGLPVSTLTPNQQIAELKAREDRLLKQIDRIASSLGVDKEWLDNAIKAGYTGTDIRDMIAAGFGRPTGQE